jgi:hypothetical protein
MDCVNRWVRGQKKWQSRKDSNLDKVNQKKAHNQKINLKNHHFEEKFITPDPITQNTIPNPNINPLNIKSKNQSPIPHPTPTHQRHFHRNITGQECFTIAPPKKSSERGVRTSLKCSNNLFSR